MSRELGGGGMVREVDGMGEEKAPYMICMRNKSMARALHYWCL